MNSPRATRSPSFPFVKPSAARARLFCFPYGGAGASVFREWKSGFDPRLELCAALPPGREMRLSDPPHTGMESLVREFADQISALLDRPFAFFGHSLGALVAFELARELTRRSLPAPKLLAVSGAVAPQLLVPSERPTYLLPDREFLDSVSRLNGLPEEVLQMPELLELALPPLRADFEIFEKYRMAPGPQLSCPIAVYSGRSDPDAPPDRLGPWRELTTAACTIQLFEGDHFYLHARRAELLSLLNQQLVGTFF